jgi:hypothetical protein
MKTFALRYNGVQKFHVDGFFEVITVDGVSILVIEDGTEETEKPLYKHDCGTCIFLYTREVNGRVYDIYFHEDDPGPTVIARYGNHAAEYKSGLGMSIEPLKEAEEYVRQRFEVKT